jgi:hypothetical protein
MQSACLKRANSGSKGTFDLPGLTPEAAVCILSDIGCLTGQRPHRTLRLDAAFLDLLAVDQEHAGAALVQTAAVRGEVVDQCNPTLRQRAPCLLGHC